MKDFVTKLLTEANIKAAIVSIVDKGIHITRINGTTKRIDFFLDKEHCDITADEPDILSFFIEENLKVQDLNTLTKELRQKLLACSHPHQRFCHFYFKKK